MGSLKKTRLPLLQGEVSGIGRAIVERFVDEGATVIAIDINEQWLQSTADEINKRVSGSCFPKTCDVTIGTQVNEVMDNVWEEFGSIDILVNNAGGGSMGHSNHLLDITEEMWDQVFDLNAKSIFLFSQSFIRKHKDRGTHGNIVNMASQAGIVSKRFNETTL
ncbi:SDR family oxidoreductase [Peribacillus frigoritolerans]|nr:SDR family oxidoreductase [Peribacillus frigoritolerans]